MLCHLVRVCVCICVCICVCVCGVRVRACRSRSISSGRSQPLSDPSEVRLGALQAVLCDDSADVKDLVRYVAKALWNRSEMGCRCVRTLGDVMIFVCANG